MGGNNSMNTQTSPKVTDTRCPKPTRAVIRQTGLDSLPDIARHGASGGYAGFIYYTDTIAFFKRNRKEIVELACSMAEEIGEPNAVALVKGFRCLQPVDAETEESIMRCLCGARLKDDDTNAANALAWFAAEEVAREMNPDV